MITFGLASPALGEYLLPSRLRSPLVNRPVDVSLLGLETFLPLLHSTFRARSANSAGTSMILMEVADRTRVAEPEQPLLETFSLLFWSGTNRFLPQETYLFQHNEIGEFPLFIVPVNRRRRYQVYEAVFNRFA